MVKTRYVRFDYFSPVIIKFEYATDPDNPKKHIKNVIEEKPFDFINWMANLKKISIKDRGVFHNQETVRADDIYTDAKTDYGIVHFTRLRETNVPAITQLLVEELQDLGLKSDEFIAEDVSCLYDHDINVLMVQRNIYSLSPSGIEFYINSFLENDSEYVELRPLVYRSAFKRGKGKNIYRSFSIKTADIRKHPSLYSKDNPISRAFKELQGLDGYDIEINIKSARGKKEKLNKARIENVLAEFEDEKEFLSKAEVGFKETDEAKVEKIDLLKGKIFSFLPFVVLPKKFLNPNVVQMDMINEYSRKRGSREIILRNR